MRDDFPLFLHRSSGRWCKKVKGRQYYFGSARVDPKGEAALKDWLARKDGIIAGLDNLRVESTGGGKTLADIAILFAAVLQHRLKTNKIADETFSDYQREIDAFANVVGPNAIAAAIGPAHFTAYFRHLIDIRKLGPHRLGTAIRHVRAMFNWAIKNGHIPAVIYGTDFVPPDTSPEALAMQKARTGDEAQDEPIFTAGLLDWLIQRATPLFQALILVAINCGIGPSDLARLRWKHVDLETGRLSLRRGKNGIKREGYLWRRTRNALQAIRVLKHNRNALEVAGDEALVFITRKNQPLVRRERVTEAGEVKRIKIANAVSITFGRWMQEAKAAGIAPPDMHLTFYNLRHTFRTHADNCTDTNAVRRCMGRAIEGSDRRYVRQPMKMRRLKRVALIVKHNIWLRQKPKIDQQGPSSDAAKVRLLPGQMRMVS